MNTKKEANILKKCINFVETKKKEAFDGDIPYTEGENEESYNITNERIFPIPEINDYRRLGFVDGGTATILNAADFNISLNRVAGVICEKNEIRNLSKTPRIIEFYSATVLEASVENKIVYTTRLFPRESNFYEYLPKEDIIIPLNELRTLMGFRFIPNIEIFGGVAMRFAEWSYAIKLIENELEHGDIFIRDGSLQAGYKKEISLVRKLHSIAEEKNVYITGLSKSCRLITENGDALQSLIDIIASNKYPEERWYFHPIYKLTKADNLADVYFVKLHKYARSPFRFDIFLAQSEKLDQKEKEVIISNISNNSKDLGFPGYPYGLIKVDQLSRISIKEVEPQKIQLVSEFDSEIYKKYILPRIRSVDAHDLINSIRKN